MKLVFVIVVGCMVQAVSWSAPPTFQHDVLPLLAKRCVACHGTVQPVTAGLDLRTLEGVMAGSVGGPVLVPGNPDASRLWTMVRDGRMPLGGKLTEEEKALLREWIEKGQFPSAEQAREKNAKRRSAMRPDNGGLFENRSSPPSPVFALHPGV